MSPMVRTWADRFIASGKPELVRKFLIEAIDRSGMSDHAICLKADVYATSVTMLRNRNIMSLSFDRTVRLLDAAGWRVVLERKRE